MSTVGTRWYTIAEAAPVLGVSVDTVRRRVRRGQLESRQVRTQHGPTWEVCLGTLQGEPAPDAEGTEGAAQGADADRSQAMAAWAASLLAPIAAELGQARETIVSQAERLERQAETIGRQTAELERAASTVVALNDQLAVTESSRRREVRRLSIALAVAATLALAAGLAPSWVR